MAKQNVTFIERHLEKLVIGVAGFILLGVVVLYGIGSPNAVEMGAESKGPSKVYEEIARQAETALQSMRTAQAPPFEPPPGLDQSIDEEVPLEIAGLFVPPNPPVPKPEGEVKQYGKLELVEIFAPTQPELHAGRAAAVLPDEQVVPPGSGVDLGPAGYDRELLALPEDVHFVTVAAAISREKQYNAFADAGYLRERRDLLVAEVLAQRQERLPNGTWSEPEIVQHFMPVRLKGQDTVEVYLEDDDWVVSPQDAAYVAAYRTALNKADAQAAVLRPDFQPFIARDPADEAELDPRLNWKIPTEFETPDGGVIDITEQGTTYDVLLPEEEEGGALVGDEKLTPTQLYREVEAMLKEGDVSPEELREIEQTLELLVQDNTEASPGVVRNAKRLLSQNARRFQEAEIAIERKARIDTDVQPVSELGEDNEPIWITDHTVEPGKTYRYRLSLLVFNPYAGVGNALKTPQDAGKLLLQGAWSKWSEPVMVEPAKYLFVMDIKAGNRARLEMYMWSSSFPGFGGWEKDVDDRFVVGDLVQFDQRGGRAPFSYDAMIVDIERGVPVPQADLRDRDYDAKMTDSLVLVHASGEVEQHLVVVDQDRRRDFVSQLDAERKAALERAEQKDSSSNRRPGYR